MPLTDNLNPFLRLKQLCKFDYKLDRLKTSTKTVYSKVDLKSWRVIFFHLMYSRNVENHLPYFDNSGPINKNKPSLLVYVSKSIAERFWEVFEIFCGNCTIFSYLNVNMKGAIPAANNNDNNVGLLDWCTLLLPFIINKLHALIYKYWQGIKHVKDVGDTFTVVAGLKRKAFIFEKILYCLLLYAPFFILDLIVSSTKILLSGVLTALCFVPIVIAHGFFEALRYFYQKRFNAFLHKHLQSTVANLSDNNNNNNDDILDNNNQPTSEVILEDNNNLDTVTEIYVSVQPNEKQPKGTNSYKVNNVAKILKTAYNNRYLFDSAQPLFTNPPRPVLQHASLLALYGFGELGRIDNKDNNNEEVLLPIELKPTDTNFIFAALKRS